MSSKWYVHNEEQNHILLLSQRFILFYLIYYTNFPLLINLKKKLKYLYSVENLVLTTGDLTSEKNNLQTALNSIMLQMFPVKCYNKFGYNNFLCPNIFSFLYLHEK